MNHLRFLRYVDEIARSGSIRAAAERLHVAPSAVNRRLQDIEQELDAPIFERLPRGMRLTAAGELFITYVRSRQAELEQVRSRIEELKGLRRGTVKLITSQGLAPSFVPQAIASFRQLHPQVEFKVQVGDHVQALGALRALETDLILVFNLDSEHDLHPIVFHEQKLLAVMHRSHRLAQGSASIRLADCASYPLALPNRDTAGRQMLERFLLRRSIEFKPTVESNSFELLRGCLYHQNALTFQFESGAMTDGGELVTREIEDRGFPLGHILMARLAKRQLPVIAHAFAEHVLSRLERQTD
jgi:DNA-binding transcriptional LysR family regulator